MIGQLSAVSEQARRADTAAAAAAIELRDLRLENDQLFSEGPGPYAQRMLADLRSSVAARDTDLDRAKRTINMLQAALDETAEEAGELKSRLGITGALPESDRAHLARRRQTEVGRLTAVVDHMQREIDTLEKERVELKRQVRLQALERGERALKLGLTVDQLYALESLADRMRGNSDITCLCDTHAVRAECAELRDIVARLRSECEGLRARADAARDTAATFVKAAAEAAAATPTIATTTRDVGTRSERSRGASRSRSPRAAYRALSPRRSASTPKPEPTTSTAPVALAPTPPTIIRVTLVERAVMTEDESEQQQLEAPTTTMDSAPAVPEAVETMDQGVDCRLGIEQLPRNVAAHADLPMVAALYHHLVETLQTKQSDGAEHKLLDSQVTAMAQELASVTAGLTTLHAQYTKARESLVEANDRLRIAEHTASDLRSECDALRTSLAAMDAGTTEPVVRELTDLTRQYVVQSVELRAMHRKSIVLQSWYESANAKAEALVADAAGAEERLGKRVLDLGRENGRLQAETAALSARLEESVPSSALIQAQSQARDSQRRHAESEARLAELLVHEMENKRLQESVASLKASLDAAERAHSGARSELAACRAQLEQVHRLEPTHSKQTMDQLRRDLIDRDTRLAIAESQRKLDQIQRTALLDAQRENEALLKTLQQRHDQVQNQNVALVEALQLHQAAALVPAASQGMDNSANNNPHQNHNEDVSVLWLELDALRKQLMHWKSENTTLKNANRRYRQLVADMQLESDQTMLLGQAHLQIADHAAQLATITSRLETTVADNRALELKVSKNDQLIHGLETQNRHLRATLVLHRQEHQLMTTALQSQLAQSVSQQQFQRLKDSLELALQHIRRLADPLPPSTATPAAGMHRVSGHDQDVEHRIELLRLSRQVDELSNLLEFKAREIDHLTATLTDTERTYFETVGLLDKSRAEHQEQLATVTDKLHELEHSLASMSDPAKLMAKLSHAELQITLLATQLEARTATIVKLETSLAASESETRRLDLALLQYQVHANGGGPSSWGEGPPRIESAPAEREDGQGIDSAETVPRAVAQSMVDSIKQQLRYKQLRLEEVEGAHAAVMSQFREKAAKHRKELLHLRNRLTDSSHQLGAAERQIADLSSHVANLEANQRALQQNGECGAVGGLVGAHENGLSTSGSTRALDTDPVAAAASRQSLSSQATSLNSVTRASVAAIFQDQHEQFSLALAEKDQELARIHQELESVGRSWQQQYGQLEHQHTQLLQKRASLLARVEDLEATVRASVPRADYDAMENRALEAQNLLAQARKDASAREERLDKAIQQLKSDLVDLTEREMLLKKAMQR
ncbi:hypothetical protein BC828DRAFT_280351 [Blastocladiella britannica]|nr:hypothetical protein BC828DRAFT_280351 [Blastocladiella britannica]